MIAARTDFETTGEMRIYGETLAGVHREAYSDTFAPGFEWLAREVAATSPDPRLFDAGCGDGAWLRYAKKAGIKGCGLDRSAAFVKMACARGLKVSHGDLCGADIPAGVTAVTALGEVLAYEPSALWPFSEAVARSLPTGGVFLLDLVSPRCRARTVRVQGSDWSLDVDITLSGDWLVRRIDVLTGGKRVSETHYQRLFVADEVRSGLEARGFSVDILSAYGPCALLEGRFAIRAERT